MAADELILITGTSRGLGRAMVPEFAERGHTVVGCARSLSAVEELRAAFGPPHRFDQVDVAEERSVHAWARGVLADQGVPNRIINNAAVINASNVLWEVPAEEFANLIDVNIKGTYHVIRHFAAAMIGQGSGVIVNISSGWGRATSPEVAPYCASKWAIEGLTRALADELPRGVAAVAVNPGIIHTEMLESCFGDAASGYPDPVDWARRAVPFLLAIGPDDSGKPLTVPG